MCGLNPITRRDVDGFCVSCRCAVATGLLRIAQGPRCRLVEFVQCGEHVLGTEYPRHIDPIDYRPERVREYFASVDAAAKVLADLETNG